MSILTHCLNCNNKMNDGSTFKYCSCIDAGNYRVYNINNFRVYVKELNMIVDLLGDQLIITNKIKNKNKEKIILKINNIEIDISYKNKFLKQIKTLLKFKSFV